MQPERKGHMVLLSAMGRARCRHMSPANGAAGNSGGLSWTWTFGNVDWWAGKKNTIFSHSNFITWQLLMDGMSGEKIKGKVEGRFKVVAAVIVKYGCVSRRLRVWAFTQRMPGCSQLFYVVCYFLQWSIIINPCSVMQSEECEVIFSSTVPTVKGRDRLSRVI